jgi:hypothetical protein
MACMCMRHTGERGECTSSNWSLEWWSGTRRGSSNMNCWPCSSEAFPASTVFGMKKE